MACRHGASGLRWAVAAMAAVSPSLQWASAGRLPVKMAEIAVPNLATSPSDSSLSSGSLVMSRPGQRHTRPPDLILDYIGLEEDDDRMRSARAALQRIVGSWAFAMEDPQKPVRIRFALSKGDALRTELHGFKPTPRCPARPNLQTMDEVAVLSSDLSWRASEESETPEPGVFALDEDWTAVSSVPEQGKVKARFEFRSTARSQVSKMILKWQCFEFCQCLAEVCFIPGSDPQLYLTVKKQLLEPSEVDRALGVIEVPLRKHFDEMPFIKLSSGV